MRSKVFSGGFVVIVIERVSEGSFGFRSVFWVMNWVRVIVFIFFSFVKFRRRIGK